MGHRLQILRLRDDEPTEPDQLGKRFTITLPTRIPNLQQAHSTFQSFHENAPLLVEILRAGASLFPCGTQPGDPKNPPPDKAA